MGIYANLKKTFYTGKQVNNSDKRGVTHSIAEIEAKFLPQSGF